MLDVFSLYKYNNNNSKLSIDRTATLIKKVYLQKDFRQIVCISEILHSRPLIQGITRGCEIICSGSRMHFVTEGRLEKMHFYQSKI